MRILTRTSVVLSAMLALAACGSKTEENVTEVRDDLVTEMPDEGNVIANIADDAPVPPAAVNVTNTVAPPPAFTDTEQMRDDADATGLTSRLPRDQAPGDAANEIQPVQ